ncbi:MAG: DNA-binding protein [Aeromicrobium sp.]|nr:DNA-binding protein [Aeromicrobium sp.]
MPPPSPRFLTLVDVAEVLNVTVRQVYALVRSGELRGIQIGGRGQWRVENNQLEDYISRQYARAEAIDQEAVVDESDDVISDR